MSTQSESTTKTPTPETVTDDSNKENVSPPKVEDSPIKQEEEETNKDVETKKEDNIKPKKKRKRNNNQATSEDFKKNQSDTLEALKTYVKISSSLTTEVKKTILDVVEVYQKEKLDMALSRGGQRIIPFGQHKGKTIMELWMDDKGKGSGRSYLLWLHNQQWLFDDIRADITALKRTL